MTSANPQRRFGSSTAKVDALAVVRWAAAGLGMSLLLLAAAPLAIPDSYSPIEHTISESGGQGVEGAWVLRAGIAIAALSVLALVQVSAPAWRRVSRAALTVYAVALMMLVAFPATSWEPTPHSEIVARTHTVSAVIGGIAFIIAVASVSRDRPGDVTAPKILDWVVITAVALIPQVMLLTGTEGLWQRVMVFLGYAWLFYEATRIDATVRSGSQEIRDRMSRS